MIFILRRGRSVNALYRYLRIKINAVRSGSEFQLSEIRLIDEEGNFFQWPEQAVVTSSMEEVGEAEGPDKCIDGLVTTKFCSIAFSPGGDIIVDLGAENSVDLGTYTRWQYYTANDIPNRDPISFEFQVSQDGADWITADSVVNANITEDRESLAYTGALVI